MEPKTLMIIQSLPRDQKFHLSCLTVIPSLKRVLVPLKELKLMNEVLRDVIP